MVMGGLNVENIFSSILMPTSSHRFTALLGTSEQLPTLCVFGHLYCKTTPCFNFEKDLIAVEYGPYIRGSHRFPAREHPAHYLVITSLESASVALE